MTLSPQVKRLARDLYLAVGSPFALSCLDALERMDWEYLASAKVEPKGYTNAEEYFLDAQASVLLRKCADLPIPKDRKRGVALANWIQGERECYKTNERLFPYLEGETHPSWNADVAQHIAGIRKIIERVLGAAPSMDVLQPRHGPGATYSDPSVRSTIADKMNAKASITSGALWFLLDWVGTKWGQEAAASSRDPVFVRGNRFAVAPKDATKDRPIGAEPSVNIFYQLALGKLIRRRLKHVGIDLDDGQSTHKQVACGSSITGRFATLDLKNASDTMSVNLVRLLLGTSWVRLLEELRSPFTRMAQGDTKVASSLSPLNGGKYCWWKLEKFSSMGNGFTFELESLIFYAVTKYVSDTFPSADGVEKVLVYGDDIICRAEISKPVTSLLRFLGFTTNKEKTFVVGPFRESCGGDFFFGQAVRPYFLKEFPCDPQSFIAAANGIRRAFIQSLGAEGFTRVKRVWFGLLDQIPSDIRRCRGPESLGDLVVHDEPKRWTTRERSQRTYFRVWRPARHLKVPLHVFDPEVVFACALYGAKVSDGFLLPRDSVVGFKLGWTLAWGTDWTPVSRVRAEPLHQRSRDIKALEGVPLRRVSRSS